MSAGNLYMAHRCGFTKKVMAHTLVSAGFDAGVKSRQICTIPQRLKSSADNSDRLKLLCSEYLP